MLINNNKYYRISPSVGQLVGKSPFDWFLANLAAAQSDTKHNVNWKHFKSNYAPLFAYQKSPVKNQMHESTARLVKNGLIVIRWVPYGKSTQKVIYATQKLRDLFASDKAKGLIVKIYPEQLNELIGKLPKATGSCLKDLVSITALVKTTRKTPSVQSIQELSGGTSWRHRIGLLKKAAIIAKTGVRQLIYNFHEIADKTYLKIKGLFDKDDSKTVMKSSQSLPKTARAPPPKTININPEYQAAVSSLAKQMQVDKKIMPTDRKTLSHYQNLRLDLQDKQNKGLRPNQRQTVARKINICVEIERRIYVGKDYKDLVAKL